MAIPRVYTWPEPDTEAICASQDMAASGSLIINGSLSEINNGGIPPFIINMPIVIFKGYSRIISITSDGDLSGVSFTITGYYNGNIVSETLDGPNDGSVYTTQLFDSVTSVQNSAAGFDIRVGTGLTGHTNWYRSNNLLTPMGMSIQVVVDVNITYSFATTLEDVQSSRNVTTFTPIVSMTNATESALASYMAPTLYSCILITDSDFGNGLVATFLEQGIK